MTPYEALTKEEINTIINYIRDYAERTTEPMASLDRILHVWNRNKQNIFDKFGGKLIHEIPVLINEPVTETRRKVHDVFYKYKSWFTSLERRYNMGVEDEEYFSPFISMGQIINKSTLVDNCAPSCKLRLGATETKINYGMKTIKVLKMICEYFGEMATFEEFRLDHSRALNTKKITGTLCVSIHPLDYMTMSDNDEGWASCMSWRNGGEYRRGTVECMNSANIIVAYLKSDTNTIECGCWNSKKWRSLFIMNDEMIFSIKGYPYQHEELANETLKFLCGVCGGHYDNYIVTYNSSNLSLGEREIKNKHIDIDYVFDSVMYNDFGTVPHYCMFSNDVWKEYKESEASIFLDFRFGGECTCMCCGDIEPNFGWEGRLVCTNCREVYHCECCNYAHDDESDLIDTPMGMICECCFEDNYRYVALRSAASNNGYDFIEAEKVATVALIPDRIELTPGMGYCDEFSCMRIRNVEKGMWDTDSDLWHKYFKATPIKTINKWGEELYVVNCKDMTTEGFKSIFDLWDESCIKQYNNKGIGRYF